MKEVHRVRLQKRIVDVIALGVGDVPRVGLRYGDGFTWILAVGQHPTNIRVEGGVARGP